MAAATKKRKAEAYPWKAGTTIGHTTNLKQSILETFDIYDITFRKFGRTVNSPRHLLSCIYIGKLCIAYIEGVEA